MKKNRPTDSGEIKRNNARALSEADSAAFGQPNQTERLIRPLPLADPILPDAVPRSINAAGAEPPVKGDTSPQGEPLAAQQAEKTGTESVSTPTTQAGHSESGVRTPELRDSAATSKSKNEPHEANDSSAFQGGSILAEMARQSAETRRVTGAAYEKQRRRILRERAEHRAKQRRRIGVGFIVLAVLAFLIWILPFFHISNFNVSGNRREDSEALVQATGLKKGEHLLTGIGGGITRFFALRHGKAEANIKAKFPYVDTVSVRPALPGTLRIVVTERIPLSYIQAGAGCVLLDKTGKILEVRSTGLPGDIPVIKNLPLDNPKAGDFAPPDVLKKLRPIMETLDSIVKSDKADNSFSLLKQVKYIWTDAHGTCLLSLRAPYASEDTTIKLGDEQTMDDDINWLRYATRTGALKNLGKGVLTASGTIKPFVPAE